MGSNAKFNLLTAERYYFGWNKVLTYFVYCMGTSKDAACDKQEKTETFMC